MSLEAQQFDSVMFFGDRFLLRQDKVADFFCWWKFPKKGCEESKESDKNHVFFTKSRSMKWNFHFTKNLLPSWPRLATR